jgi:hypothetical protein
MYSASFEEVAVTAIQDLFQILAPADSVVLLHALLLSQSTDAGDTESEQLPVLIHRGSTDGSGGSTPTPTPLHLGDTAAGTVVEANNTTQGTEGPFIHAEAFNVMAGLAIWWTPETRPVISPSDLLHIELQVAPVDSINMNGTIYFEELGG